MREFLSCRYKYSEYLRKTTKHAILGSISSAMVARKGADYIGEMIRHIAREIRNTLAVE